MCLDSKATTILTISAKDDVPNIPYTVGDYCIRHFAKTDAAVASRPLIWPKKCFIEVLKAILRIHFPYEGKTWAAKIPFEQRWPFYEVSVRPLEFLARKHPRIPAPRVHGYVDAGAEGENPVGVAYILMDWMDGSHIQPWSLSEPSISARHRVLEQIADIMLEMLSKNTVDGGVYFYSVSKSTPKNIPVPTVAAVHLDIHNANIIVDEDWKITGLMDWDFMSAKLIEHIPGAAPSDLPAGYTNLNFAQDKAYFVAVLAEKEGKPTSKTDITKLVESSTERAFFEMSHNARTVHKEFAERFCKRTRANVEAARTELGRFLTETPGISRDDVVVAEVEKELEELLTNMVEDDGVVFDI